MVDTWQPIPLDAPWGDFEPGYCLLYTNVDAIVVDAQRDDDGGHWEDNKIKLVMQRINGERFEEKVKPSVPIGKTGAARLSGDGSEGDLIRALVIPTVVWSEDKLFSTRNLVVMLATTLAFTLMTAALSGSMLYLAFLTGGAAGESIRRFWKSPNKVQIMAPDKLGITMETILPYALTLEQGKLWVPPSASADRRQLVIQRVDAIRTHYLELREDIAYRIECSALFDQTVSTTAEFEAALVAFDDATDATSTDELDALASDVEVSFNVAQANAERLGFEHLPEQARSDARRAGKAARLAAGATTEGERQASLTQVKRILDSLALYYLPTLDERLAIEAGPSLAKP
ncbi:hypothetical protein [uncultured Tessaracoccus sp.]|uniref:hypothetical protein n=1 Tax=uncultured Tessaracoccus sp. TaxID=905023 RepID=UPI002631D15A|nr:hypothetical protein [uncultured Tessaracoccus sp.]